MMTMNREGLLNKHGDSIHSQGERIVPRSEDSLIMNIDGLVEFKDSLHRKLCF